jgi:PKD repeat protein
MEVRLQMKDNRLFTAITAAAAVVSLVACPADEPPPRDSAADQPHVIPDGIAGGEGGGTETVDFVVQGCEQRTASQCKGEVPLTLTFIAVISGAPTSFTWGLGGGAAAATGKIVSHTYTTPGTYDVSLTVAKSGGTTSKLKTAFVVAQKAGPGAACTDDGTCASGTCVCQGAAGCPVPLNGGICLHKCEQQCPQQPTKTICVDLSSSAGGGAANAWRTRLCLPACATDAECERPGFSCRLAPTSMGWVTACLPPIPRGVGEPCRTAAGKPDHSLCLGGVCMEMGASGYCSGSCQVGTCPPQARCVQYGTTGAKPVCVARCLLGTCAVDPLLACQLPGLPGDHGFTVLGAPDPAGTTYCSTKSCKAAADCGLTGSCDEAAGGYCVMK